MTKGYYGRLTRKKHSIYNDIHSATLSPLALPNCAFAIELTEAELRAHRNTAFVYVMLGTATWLTL